MSRSAAGRLGYLKIKHKWAAALKRKQTAAIARQLSCLHCGELIPYRKHPNIYCSRRCYGDSKFRPVFCICGTQIAIGAAQALYCSNACGTKKRRLDKTEKWLRGEISGGTWCGVYSFVRFWLMEQEGERCIECGWNEINRHSGKIPVQVDHINGDPLDHTPANLRLVCPSCHSLTASFGALNKGSGRSRRYKKVRR